MSVTSKIKLLAKLRDKDYRDAYVEEKVATSLPFQIRALREQPGRDWSQAELGKRAGMRQNAISRLEDAESGTPSINTLLRLARAFDVALLVKFVPFSKLLSEFADLSSEALSAFSFEEEIESLEEASITEYAVPMTTHATLGGLTLPYNIDRIGPWKATIESSAFREDWIDLGSWVFRLKTTEAEDPTTVSSILGDDFLEDLSLTTAVSPSVFNRVPQVTELVN
jgi:transcriptional regulator with XRE-family HTH domain